MNTFLFLGNINWLAVALYFAICVALAAVAAWASVELEVEDYGFPQTICAGSLVAIIGFMATEAGLEFYDGKIAFYDFAIKATIGLVAGIVTYVATTETVNAVWRRLSESAPAIPETELELDPEMTELTQAYAWLDEEDLSVKQLRQQEYRDNFLLDIAQAQAGRYVIMPDGHLRPVE